MTKVLDFPVGIMYREPGFKKAGLTVYSGSLSKIWNRFHLGCGSAVGDFLTLTKREKPLAPGQNHPSARLACRKKSEKTDALLDWEMTLIFTSLISRGMDTCKQN